MLNISNKFFWKDCVKTISATFSLKSECDAFCFQLTTQWSLHSICTRDLEKHGRWDLMRYRYILWGSGITSIDRGMFKKNRCSPPHRSFWSIWSGAQTEGTGCWVLWLSSALMRHWLKPWMASMPFSSLTQLETMWQYSGTKVEMAKWVRYSCVLIMIKIFK